MDLGLVHAPVTPFTRAGRVDFEVYSRLIEFHLRNGADALALPMHAGESVSLTEAERRGLLERDWKHARPTSKGRLFLNDLLEMFLTDRP